MSKVKTSWGLGNFAMALECEVTPENEAILLEAGLRALGQAVQVDPILGGFETVDGKQVRRKGWKRGDVAFSEEKAKEIEAAMAAAKVNGKALGFVAKATFKAGDFKEEIYIVGLHESKGDLETWLLDRVEYAGDTHDSAGEYSQEMLAAVRAFKIRMLS